jgi:hypothetical protein
MAVFSWISTYRDLSPAALTVRAQALPYNDRGTLLWDRFFPRRNVGSIRLSDITTLDVRAAADRRDWNAPGRRIPLETPPYRNLEMVPIEAEHVIDEREMQILMERNAGNGDLVIQALRADIPGRVEMLAMADYRRLEYDTFQAWANGTVVVRNPQDASKTYTVSYGIAGSRYTTAGTAWNDVSINGYDAFLAWLDTAASTIGPLRGAMMRRATWNAILTDAPTASGGAKETRAGLNDRLTADLGYAFEIIENEHSVDIFDDGGTAKTRTKVWPAQKVAAIPVGDEVGYTAFAPVYRAQEMAASVPGAGIDSNGVTVYYNEQNSGKELIIQAQLNALTVPDDQRVFVIDAGV